MAGQADRPPGQASASDARPFSLLGHGEEDDGDGGAAAAPPTLPVAPTTRAPVQPRPRQPLHLEQQQQQQQRQPKAAAAAPPPEPQPQPQPPQPSTPWPLSLLWDDGACAAACAALSFSLAVLFVKLLNRRVPVLEITLARSGLSLLATLLVAFLRGHSLALASPGTWGGRELRPLLLLRGAIGCVAMVLYYLALVRLPMADAVLLFFVNVPATALAAWLVAGERMNARAIAGAVGAVAGLVLVLHPPWLFGGHDEWGPERFFGVAAGLGSAALSACAFLTIRAIGKREPALVVALYFHAATVLISVLPLLVFRFPEPPVWPGSVEDFSLLLGIAAGSFLGQLCLTRSFQLLPAGRASAINLLQVLFSTLWAWLAFGEVPTPVGFGGGVLIVVGALLCGGGGGGGGTGQAATAARQQQQAEEEETPLTSERSAPSEAAVKAPPAAWAAVREAAAAGVGSQISLLPRSQREALAMSEAAAATLEDEEETGRRRRSSAAGL
jgi:drug/metabolite transporter (DMT)-like permease